MGESRGDFLCLPLVTEVNHMVPLSSSRPAFLRHQCASPKRGPMAGASASPGSLSMQIGLQEHSVLLHPFSQDARVTHVHVKV